MASDPFNQGGGIWEPLGWGIMAANLLFPNLLSDIGTGFEEFFNINQPTPEPVNIPQPVKAGPLTVSPETVPAYTEALGVPELTDVLGVEGPEQVSEWINEFLGAGGANVRPFFEAGQPPEEIPTTEMLTNYVLGQAEAAAAGRVVPGMEALGLEGTLENIGSQMVLSWGPEGQLAFVPLGVDAFGQPTYARPVAEGGTSTMLTLPSGENIALQNVTPEQVAAGILSGVMPSAGQTHWVVDLGGGERKAVGLQELLEWAAPLAGPAPGTAMGPAGVPAGATEAERRAAADAERAAEAAGGVPGAAGLTDEDIQAIVDAAVAEATGPLTTSLGSLTRAVEGMAPVEDTTTDELLQLLMALQMNPSYQQAVAGGGMPYYGAYGPMGTAGQYGFV